MKSNEVREKYVQYFKDKGHIQIPSAPLIPDDSTTLFTGAGMQPLLHYLLGKKHSEGNRLVNSQKSFRGGDIEEVGDLLHTTLFEMLGNWSLGDYFKEKQLNWIFDFLTEEIGLNPQRMYVTVFQGNEKLGIPRDKEAVKIWKDVFERHGVPAKEVYDSKKDDLNDGRIFYYDESKNWWSRFGEPENMPDGEPGGPDSEIFYDLGSDLKLHENSPYSEQKCHINCECGRFVEIGNNVFMEYVKKNGGFEPLEKKNIDFGGGLERITMVSEGVSDIFMTDLFLPIIEKIEKKLNASYEENPRPLRIIADHIKGAAFVAAEGVIPSNTDRGYILRRLIRRCVTFIKLLDQEKQDIVGHLESFIDEVIEIYNDVFPEINENRSLIIKTLKEETDQFQEALNQGMREFNKRYPEEGSDTIAGESAFDLYQSYGLPLEIIKELAKERGKTLDEKGFNKEFKKHKEISRAGAEKKFGGHGLELDTGELKAGTDEEAKKVVRLHTATHLMHQALHDILGETRQEGSDINPERTRFDFKSDRKLTDEELEKLEDTVNEKIQEDLPVNQVEMLKEEALETGARHYFRAKYPDTVSIYYVGPSLEKAYSKEFCGGPHVNSTGEIGKFKILKHKSVGSDVKRLRATVE